MIQQLYFYLLIQAAHLPKKMPTRKSMFCENKGGAREGFLLILIRLLLKVAKFKIPRGQPGFQNQLMWKFYV